MTAPVTITTGAAGELPRCETCGRSTRWLRLSRGGRTQCPACAKAPPKRSRLAGRASRPEVP